MFRIGVKKHASQKQIVLSVTDTGSGSHAKTAKAMSEIRDKYQNKDYSAHHSIRGRGLFLIIHQLVDNLEFLDDDKGGLTVKIEKDLSS